MTDEAATTQEEQPAEKRGRDIELRNLESDRHHQKWRRKLLARWNKPIFAHLAS